MWIYRIYNLISDRSYIGQTGNLKKRWYQHRYYLRKGIHDNGALQAEWIRLGEPSFHFEVIEECASDIANAREGALILRYGALQPFGYNISVVMYRGLVREGMYRWRKKWAGPSSRVWSERCKRCEAAMAPDEGLEHASFGLCYRCAHSRATIIGDSPAFWAPEVVEEEYWNESEKRLDRLERRIGSYVPSLVIGK